MVRGIVNCGSWYSFSCPEEWVLKITKSIDYRNLRFMLYIL